jgi:hypothetical protein
MFARSFIARAGLVALGCAAGCGSQTQTSYSLEIVGSGDDLFAGATVAILEVNGQMATSTPVIDKAPISLSIPSLDPRTTPSAFFSVRALDAAGKVIAYGQTPEIELLYMPASVRVFVQPPATLAHGQDADEPHSEHFAISLPAIPISPFALTVRLPLFGTGKTRLQSTTTTGEVFSPELYLYNPLMHVTEDIGTVVSQTSSTTVEYRTGVAAASREDGYAFVFGGRLQPPDSDPNSITLSSQLDAFRVGRDGVTDFIRELAPAATDPESARMNTVLVATAQPVYAIGGLDANSQPLDTVVRMDVVTDSAGNGSPTLGRIAGQASQQPFHLKAPRSGHTATAVRLNSNKVLVLVFGGAPAGGAVAEIFDPDALTSALPAAQPASPRHNHAALVLPGDGDSVLILGGSDGTKPLDDGLIYSTKDGGTFKEHVLKLQTARENFTAFIVNKDIVVFGGRGPGGQLLGDGEIFDTDSFMATGTFAAVGTVQSLPRAGASVTVLTNESAILIGGEVDDIMKPGFTIPTNRIDIYQPRR